MNIDIKVNASEAMTYLQKVSRQAPFGDWLSVVTELHRRLST